jgi:hypothetical protein
MSPEFTENVLDVNDNSLIKWFQNNYDKIAFINISDDIWLRRDRSASLKTSIGKLDKEIELHEQKEILIEIWKDLVANAVIFLKKKDKREAYHDDGDYGIDELGDFFEAYCEFEKLLYGTSDFYRDHVSHVFKVFLLGEYLVHHMLGGFSNLNVMDNKLILKPSEIVNNYEPAKKVLPMYPICEVEEIETRKYAISDEEKEAMWCIVSLTHDLGYPTKIIHLVSDKMKKMLGTFHIDVSYTASQQSQIFNDFIVKLISSDLQEQEIFEEVDSTKLQTSESLEKNKKPKQIKKVYYTTHLQTKYYSKFSRSLEMWDHGIETCVLLVKTLIYFLETDLKTDPNSDKKKMMDILDARHFLIRQRILRAIASHSCDYIYHLKLDMSLMLRIVDEMQEWGRPKLSDLFSLPLKSKLEICTFKNKIIDYKIEYEYERGTPPEGENIKKIHTFIKEYFRRKIDTYIMILRSAVDGKNRNLTLRFRVIDSVERNKGKIFTYDFVHENSNSVQIYISHKNKKETKQFHRVVRMDLFDNEWCKFEVELDKLKSISEEEWTKFEQRMTEISKDS